MKRIVQLTESDFDTAMDYLVCSLRQLGSMKRKGQIPRMAEDNLRRAIEILNDQDQLDKKVRYLEGVV